VRTRLLRPLLRGADFLLQVHFHERRFQPPAHNFQVLSAPVRECAVALEGGGVPGILPLHRENALVSSNYLRLLRS